MSGPDPTPPIRLLIADDQALFREALALLLAVSPDLSVVGEAANGEEAVRHTLALRPDVVLMDLRMPILDGAAATRRLRDEGAAARVIVLTTFDDDADVFAALRAGAVGYLLKDAPGEQLVAAVRAASRGESFLPPAIAAKVVAEFARLSGQPATAPLTDPLSERETEVLHLLATGLSNRELAARLYIAEGTVKNHVTSILAKLDARDRAHAVLRARDLGLV